MKSVLRVGIIGAGGHARVILDTLKELNGFRVVGFLDDDPRLEGGRVNGHEVLGPAEALPGLAKRHRLDGMVVGLGDNRLRARFFQKVLQSGLICPNVIHPTAHLSKRIRLGRGVVMMAGVIVNTDTVIGDNVCINTGATVDHDCLLGTSAFIAPGAHLAGSVRVGERAWVGIGASVLDNISIGDDAVIGAGSVVIRDVPKAATVVGIPAEPIRRRRHAR